MLSEIREALPPPPPPPTSETEFPPLQLWTTVVVIAHNQESLKLYSQNR